MNKFVKTIAALIGIVVATALFSCDDKGDKFDETTLSISQKWDISTSNSPYSSFEFNKDGMYIVIEKGYGVRSSALTDGAAGKRSLFQRRGSPSGEVSLRAGSPGVHIGKYSVGKNNNTVTMTDFGTVDIIDITADEFEFMFTPQSGSPSNYKARKSNDLVSSSSKTELLCRNWVFDKVTIDESKMDQDWIDECKEEYGSNWKSLLAKEINEDLKGSTVLFTRAGTYISYYQGDLDDAEYGLWKWANSAENAFVLAEIYMDEFQWWWDDEPIVVKELTASSFKFAWTDEWKEEGLIIECKIAK